MVMRNSKPKYHVFSPAAAFSFMDIFDAALGKSFYDTTNTYFISKGATPGYNYESWSVTTMILFQRVRESSLQISP